MQQQDNGSYITVRMTKEEVREWARRWPCNGLTIKAVYFEFSKASGDLVDTNVHGEDGGAKLALSQDAQKFCGLYRERKKVVAKSELKKQKKPPRSYVFRVNG